MTQLPPEIHDRRQTIRDNGYTPLPLYEKEPPIYGKNNKTKGFPGWQKLNGITTEEVTNWGVTWPDATNTGALTRLTPTLDADILVPEAADAVEALARERFAQRGRFMVRTGKAPKRAIRSAPMRRSRKSPSTSPAAASWNFWARASRSWSTASIPKPCSPIPGPAANRGR